MLGSYALGDEVLGEATATGARSRRVRATGDGVATTDRDTDDGLLLPIDTHDAPLYAVPAAGLGTDHDTLSVALRASTAALDGPLDRYLDAADVAREPTAYGAFRRLPRDGTAAVTVEPGAALRPPFEDREVVPVDASTEQVGVDTHVVELTLGLVEPRARDPPAGDGEIETITTASLSVAGGATASTTLSGDGPGSVGDYLARALTDSDSDEVQISVTDADLTLSFPTGTLALPARQLGRPTRTGAAGRTQVTIPLRLTAGQVRTLFAVGSRVDAAALRSRPDAENAAVDSTPDGELTAGLDAPDGVLNDLGDTVVLEAWSATLARPRGRLRFDAELTLSPTA